MKKRVFKILKNIGKTLLVIIGLLGLYALATYILPKFTTDKEIVEQTNTDIHILTNGVHTDIVVPIRSEQVDWSKKVLFSNTVSKDTTYNYLAMGWGDKGFYLETPTWAELKPSVAFNAAFGLSTTAIHATYYHNMEESDVCRKITLSSEQYKRLISYIDNSFEKNNSNEFKCIKTSAVYSDSDAFYEANGSYSMIHTCNTWANGALKSCGQKACLWTAFDTGIFNIYKTKN